MHRFFKFLFVAYAVILVIAFLGPGIRPSGLLILLVLWLAQKLTKPGAPLGS